MATWERSDGDCNTFDGLTKLLAASPSRRTALGVLLGAGLAGKLGAAEAKKTAPRSARAAGRPRAAPT